MDIESTIPILLRDFSTVTEKDISIINSLYSQHGRGLMESAIRKEKSNVPFASYLFKTLGCDEGYWRNIYESYERRNKHIFYLLDKLFRDFKNSGIKTICVYENFGTVLSADMPLGCFSSGDVDLSVDLSEENKAIEIINKNGFYFNIRKDHAHISNKLVLPFYNQEALGGKGYWLNIMRKPLCRNFMLNQNNYANRLDFLRKTETEFYKNSDIRILKPTPMLYYNALHFACEHYYSASPGMSLCCDIDRIIRAREIDWDSIMLWSKEDKAGLRIRLALDVCNYFLKTPVNLEIFGEESRRYTKLRSRIIDDVNNRLIPQVGKISRLKTELASDDMPAICSIVSRLLQR